VNGTSEKVIYRPLLSEEALTLEERQKKDLRGDGGIF